MFEIASLSFATFFATIGPLDAAAVFAALTAEATPAHRRAMAIRGTAVGAAILLVFALFGQFLLTRFGISLAALRAAGGILLLLIGIDMVFARASGGTTTTAEETQEASGKQDISVFPLATPLIAGPGAMGAAIIWMANAKGEFPLQAMVILALLGVLAITFVAMMGATTIHKVLGVTGMHVISRVFGVLLSALAVQFIFDGVREGLMLAGTSDVAWGSQVIAQAAG
jgi:multiple antibiotic resistance protein